MLGKNTANIDEYREYLSLLGRLQLDDKLAGKVDVSGVVQMTLLEAGQAGWDSMETDQRVTWLRRIFANNLLDEIRRFRTQARDVDRERSIEQSASRVNEWLVGEQSSPSTKAVQSEEALRLAKAVLSFLPGIFAMVGICTASQRFTEMATSPNPPKPAEFAAVTGAAMSYGFLGIASTIVPVMLGLLAFRRYCQRTSELPTVNE